MHPILSLISILALTSALFPIPETQSAHRPDLAVHFLNDAGKESTSFPLPSANEGGGLTIAAEDLGNDGVPELVVGNGLGNAPTVHVLQKDGTEIGSFLAYEPSMGTGINVAACDMDGDGMKEIVTAPQGGGGPQVRIFTNLGIEIPGGTFFAYAETFRGGVNIACGDLDNDGRAELVTLPMTSGGPHVRVWKLENGTVHISQEFFSSDTSDNRGLVGVVHNGNLAIANQRGSETTIKTFSGKTFTLIGESKISIDATGVSSLFVKNNLVHLATTSKGKIINTQTGQSISVPSPFGSIAATSAAFTQGGSEEFITVPYRPMYMDDYQDLPRSLVVDISDQRIFAYEYGVLVNTFLVSTARAGYQTPRGETTIMAMPYLVRYAWSYSPGNPNNYDLGYVPYNMRVFPHIYIHYAPWHNNFGHPMSHGCINVSLDNVRWLYNSFAQVGDRVLVRD